VTSVNFELDSKWWGKQLKALEKAEGHQIYLDSKRKWNLSILN